ncbi:MAG: efflux RND transporter periplasmic adaptor subunit, partial [Prevotella sp.]
MKKKKISGVWIIVGVVFAIAIVAWLLSRNKKDDTVNFTTEAVAPANIENSVTATGSIEAVKTVTVGTQVSGIIDKLYVDYNSVVKKGQVIAELDKQNLQSQLNSSKAALSEAQANLTSALSDLAYQK